MSIKEEDSGASGVFREGSLEEVVLLLTLKGGGSTASEEKGQGRLVPTWARGTGTAETEPRVLRTQSSVLANLKIPTLYFFLSLLVPFLPILLPIFFLL